MTRLFVRCGLYALVIASVAILLVRAHPYDDHELRWLPVDNCFASCFMGIRPGVTTIEEAMALLKAHPWVSQVRMEEAHDSYQLVWTWSDNAPDFLKHGQTVPTTDEIRFDKGIVSNIDFDTTLTFGDIALAWRYPDESQLILPGLMIAPDSSSVFALINLKYEGFQVSGTLGCPYATHIWQTQVHISVTGDPHSMSSISVFPVAGRGFLGSIRHTSQLMCSRQY